MVEKCRFSLRVTAFYAARKEILCCIKQKFVLHEIFFSCSMNSEKYDLHPKTQGFSLLFYLDERKIEQDFVSFSSVFRLIF